MSKNKFPRKEINLFVSIPIPSYGYNSVFCDDMCFKTLHYITRIYDIIMKLNISNKSYKK